jgi:hypothetical protein
MLDDLTTVTGLHVTNVLLSLPEFSRPSLLLLTLPEYFLLQCSDTNATMILAQTMSPTGRLAGIAAALLSLIFLLSGLAHLRGSDTTGNYVYSNRPSHVRSGLGKASKSFQGVQNLTLGV